MNTHPDQFRQAKLIVPLFEERERGRVQRNGGG